MKQRQNMECFAKGPVSKAVLQNALPAIAAMLMVLVYNLADTFLSARPTTITWSPPYRWRHRFS